MGALLLFVDVIAVIVACIVYAAAAERRELAAMSPEERQAHHERRAEAVVQRMRQEREQQQVKAVLQYGPISPLIVCPHCRVKGHVHTRIVKQKKGISGAKATAAVMTVGASMFVTGLSRKEKNMQAYCGNCHSVWML